MKPFLVCNGCPWGGRGVPGPLARAGAPAKIEALRSSRTLYRELWTQVIIKVITKKEVLRWAQGTVTRLI